jgi:L-lactate dehydrogenase
MRIAIVGMGRVGAQTAFTLAMRGLADELLLVDASRETASGEALDLVHAEAFMAHPLTVRAASLQEVAGCDVVVLSCSAPWRQEYTSRFDLGRDNLKIFRQILPPLAAGNPGAKYLVITNPVDVMTFHAIELTGAGAARVFGSGTLIDSARFRSLLSAKVGIHADDVRAYILGEHGETQFPAFSSAFAGGAPIPVDTDAKAAFEEARTGGWQVVRKKGHTSYAIALAAALVVEAIAWDTRRTMPLSVACQGRYGLEDICLSLPVVMGREGIVRVIEPELSEDERTSLKRCGGIVRDAISLSLTPPPDAS